MLRSPHTLILLFNEYYLLPPCKPDAFGSPDEVIEQSTHQVNTNDYHQPYDFIISVRWFFGSTIHNHPEPED